LNFLAAYIAYRVTMSYLDQEELNMKRALEATSKAAAVHDSEF
jgi:hypothetical protein